MPNTIDKDEAIRAIVRASVSQFATGFQARHVGEYNNPDGTINMKIHNVFIAALGPEIQYYTALVRSFDSSLGNMLEKLAIEIARLNFAVHRKVEGPLSPEQTSFIGSLLESYKRRSNFPDVADYEELRSIQPKTTADKKRHESDYFLIDRDTGHHYLIELKIGGDLDNKKARAEKEALLEQFAILSNTISIDTPISIRFATAYNRYEEGQPWLQGRVRQYFADDELLIGKNFWNFVCGHDNGYQIVIDEYQRNASEITTALETIKHTYLD